MMSSYHHMNTIILALHLLFSIEALSTAPPTSTFWAKSTSTIHSTNIRGLSRPHQKRRSTDSKSFLLLFGNEESSDETTSTTKNRHSENDGFDVDITASANELQSILILDSSFSSTSQKEQRIQELMQTLIDSKVSFDPSICINGPLFQVLYQTGPTKPFWEKYDLKFWTQNIKGQQYTTATGNGQKPSFDVINYAEFWGRNLYIQGCGICAPTIKPSSISSSNDDDDSEENYGSEKDRLSGSKSSPFSFVSSFFLPLSPSSSSQKQQKQKQVLTCPVDYKVEIQNASVTLFNQYKWSLNVSGIGYTRILFANENLRILLAPNDTSDDTWMEKAGLIVVQVKSELVLHTG